MIRRALAVAGCVVAVSACAVHGFKPPVGPSVPAPDGIAIWQQATSACRTATTFSAQLHVSGKANGQRVRGTIDGAVTARDQIYLRANAPFGQTAFKLAGAADHATLVLPSDNRFVEARAADIVDALTGLAWGPRDLLDVLTGCVVRADANVDISRIGDHLRVKTQGGDVFLRRNRSEWEVEGGIVGGLAIGYSRRADGWPSEVVITSQTGASREVALKIGVEQVATTPLPDITFILTAPADATALTMDELRAMFGGKGR